MKREDFLALAKELSRRATEACWRTAMSRAYFAAFHQSRDFLSGLGFQTRKNDQAHGGLYRRLSGSKSDGLIELSRLLIALRSRRNQADYDLDDAVTEAEAVEAAQDADAAFEILNSYRQPTVLSAITEAIRVYERDVLREVTWQNV